jgi:hypothetical protein
MLFPGPGLVMRGKGVMYVGDVPAPGHACHKDDCGDDERRCMSDAVSGACHRKIVGSGFCCAQAGDPYYWSTHVNL